MIEGIVPREIREGPDAIRATVADAAGPAAGIAARWRAAGVRRIHVIGNGTSYHSSIAATTLYRRYAAPDDPAVVAVTAADFLRYPPRLGPADAVVGISSSGEFKDVVAVARALRGRVPMAGIVHVAGSTLTGLVSDLVLTTGGPSVVPVMTKTFSSTLVGTELLLMALLGESTAAAQGAALLHAADHAEAAVAAAEPLVEQLAASLRTAGHVFVTGGGLGYPAALEAALKLKEMALVHAEGAEVWEMTSGAATMLGPEAVLVALAPDGPARPAIGELLEHAAAWGTRTIEVGSARLLASSDLLPLPGGTNEEHAPIVAVPPVALLGFALARIRGADPDHPGWIERYHSQGLTHILVGGQEATQ